eukprot:3460014-Rhodomonas_salina.1
MFSADVTPPRTHKATSMARIGSKRYRRRRGARKFAQVRKKERSVMAASTRPRTTRGPRAAKTASAAAIPANATPAIK